MPKKSTINQQKYDSTHCRFFGLKLNLTLDADVIEKLCSVPSMQGYIKQLIRNDINRDSVPVPLSSAALSILEEEAARTGVQVPDLISTIVSESVMELLASKENGKNE